MSQVVRTFAFLDLAGFSALTEAHGDRQAVELLARFEEIVRDALATDGLIVKSIGDALMLAFDDAASAADTVTRLVERCHGEGDFPAVRIGLHHGPAIGRDGDFFGSTVNIAARVAAHAAGEQVLATEEVAEAFRGRDVAVASIGPVRFRNLSDDVEVFDVRLRDPHASHVIDPICRMRITPTGAPAQVRIGDQTWWFCSMTCAAQFTAQSGPSAQAPPAPQSMAPVNQALLERARQLGAREAGLAVVTTRRADGSTQASVVNAGVLAHPVSGEPVVGFVARGGARKLAHLRLRPRTTVIFRSGWEWVAVEGDADLAGPDDDLVDLPSSELRRMLRTVYAAAVGGSVEDWADLDEVLVAERHTAVLIRPTRVYSNPAE